MTTSHLSVVSVDVLALHYDGDTGTLRVAVPRRDRDPYAGCRALPGVVLTSGERLEAAARRALAKFTYSRPAVIGQLRTFDEPSRDPRGPSLSIAMFAVLDHLDDAVAADIAAPPNDLGFDHTHIIDSCRPLLASHMLTDREFTRSLLPNQFTSVDARNIQTALTGVVPHMGNLNRALDDAGATKSEDRVTTGRGRPAVLRSFSD